MNDAKTEAKDEFFVANAKTTLQEAKVWLRARFSKGATCPCCNQFVKLYRRPFNKSMAFVLLLMARYYRRIEVKESDWLHVPSYINEVVASNPRRSAAVRGDWAKLKFWGLIEEKPETRDDGSPRVGYWRMTPVGRQFVARQGRCRRTSTSTMVSRSSVPSRSRSRSTTRSPRNSTTAKSWAKAV